jgi:hypothetical protein
MVNPQVGFLPVHEPDQCKKRAFGVAASWMDAPDPTLREQVVGPDTRVHVNPDAYFTVPFLVRVTMRPKDVNCAVAVRNTRSGIVTGASIASAQARPPPVHALPQPAWSPDGTETVAMTLLGSGTVHAPTHGVPGGETVSGCWVSTGATLKE